MKVILLALLFVGCSPVVKEAIPERLLVKRGKVIYRTACTSCHNSDPTKAGAVGPAVFGSSFDLIKARITYGKGVMPSFKQFKSSVPALEAYLNYKESE